MRARAVRMIVSIVAVVCVLMGLPGAFFASASIWSSEQRNLDVQAQLILQNIERRRAVGEGIDPATLAALVADQANSRGDELNYRIKVPEANLVTNGTVIPGRTMSSLASSPSGVSVQLTASASNALNRIAWTCALFGGGMLASMLIGWLFARSLSRELSAPLIYLAAQAEQIARVVCAPAWKSPVLRKSTWSPRSSLAPANAWRADSQPSDRLLPMPPTSCARR